MSKQSHQQRLAAKTEGDSPSIMLLNALEAAGPNSVTPGMALALYKEGDMDMKMVNEDMRGLAEDLGMTMDELINDILAVCAGVTFNPGTE